MYVIVINYNILKFPYYLNKIKYNILLTVYLISMIIIIVCHVYYDFLEHHLEFIQQH